MKNGYPGIFRPERVKKVLEGDVNELIPSFLWADTPQGDFYWRTIWEKGTPLTGEQKGFLRNWLQAYNVHNGIAEVIPKPTYDKWDPKNWGLRR